LQRARVPFDRADRDPPAHPLVEHRREVVAEIGALPLDAQVRVRGAHEQQDRETDDREPPASASARPSQRAPDAITTVGVQRFLGSARFSLPPTGPFTSRWQSKHRRLYWEVRTESEGIEMSVDTPPEPESLPTQDAPVLRREALLPNERSRGLGTVAVVCTMAGVASGLALATTLMAMQVADTMSARTCPYRAVEMATPTESNHGFLGIRYVFAEGVARVHSVLADT